MKINKAVPYWIENASTIMLGTQIVPCTHKHPFINGITYTASTIFALHVLPSGWQVIFAYFMRIDIFPKALNKFVSSSTVQSFERSPTKSWCTCSVHVWSTVVVFIADKAKTINSFSESEDNECCCDRLMQNSFPSRYFQISPMSNVPILAQRHSDNRYTRPVIKLSKKMFHRCMASLTIRY